MKFMTTKQIEDEYGMPVPTQKAWRQAGKFKEGRDFIKIGKAVAYKPKAIERHEGLKKYIEKKDAK